MSSQLDADVTEIKDRVKRLESRMVQLGDHVGANLRAKLRIHPKTDNEGFRVVEVDSFDVSISRLMTDLRGIGWKGNIQVEIQGVRIATLHLT